MIISSGLLHRVELDHHVAGTRLTLERLIGAAANQRTAAILADRRRRALGIFGIGFGVRDGDAGNDIAFGHQALLLWFGGRSERQRGRIVKPSRQQFPARWLPLLRADRRPSRWGGRPRGGWRPAECPPPA